MFGYEGYCCDLALRADNVDMLKECVELDYIDAETRMLTFPSVLNYCEVRGLEKCAEYLRGIKVAA